MTLPGEVPFVGKGSAKVVEFRGTITLAVTDAVPLVGTGGTSVSDPGDGEGARVLLLEGNGGNPVGDGGSSVGDGGTIEGEGGTSVGDGGISVGAGGNSVGDGGTSVGEPGTGATKVVELTGTMILVATGVPLTKMVVTPAVMAGEDSTGAPVVLIAGTLVVVFSGGGVNVYPEEDGSGVMVVTNGVVILGNGARGRVPSTVTVFTAVTVDTGTYDVPTPPRGV